MNSAHLLPGEEIITQSNSRLITLTNYRLRHHDSVWGKSKVTSILLEKIASVEVHYKSRPIFLVLAVISFIVGYYVSTEEYDSNARDIGLVVAIVFVVLYFVTRRNFISVASSGGATIDFHTESMGVGQVLDFVNTLEQAMIERVAGIVEDN